MKIQESRENYLEAILVLEKQKGQVRSIDVANFLDFSKPSVSVAVNNLKNALLLTVTPEGWLKLTEAGRALAEQVYERHLLLSKILIAMGVDETTAQDDACRVEHVISQASFERIKAYAKRAGIEP
ncbi:MAG: metal-dependent transcriptional regulator [Clostridia bacterium]|nr:metal-dependent transcriptional regulator [Clostridia bacterium]